ncbi:MAG TPA: ABC transporter permease, partial [Acidimicrobiales bacterium]
LSACYTNLAIRMTISRDFGVLKRVRGTPIPSWVYLAGQFGSSIFITVVLVGLTTLLGIVAYGVTLRAETLPAIVVTLALGAVAFCALGLAVSGLCPNSDAAPAIVNFSIFPLLFISGIFFPLDTAPGWLRTLAEIFPVQHLANGLQFAFDPRTRGLGFAGDDLLILTAWMIAGIFLAHKYFRWESSRG